MKIVFYIFIINFAIANLAMANLVDINQENPKLKAKNKSFQTTPNYISANNRSSQKVDKLADKIISALELKGAEAKTIHDLCEARAIKIEKIKLNSDDNQQKISDLQVVNQVFDEQIKQLVSPNQYQKYEALRKNGH
jgi:hypothetical protein